MGLGRFIGFVLILLGVTFLLERLDVISARVWTLMPGALALLAGAFLIFAVRSTQQRRNREE